MNTNTLTYIIITVAVIGFVVFRVLPFFRRASRLTQGVFSKIYINKRSTLSPEQYRKIALGAIYSEQQTAFINSLETGLGKGRIRELLAEWWGISNPAEAKTTLTYLQHKGFRFYFPTVLRAFDAPEHQQETIIASSFDNREDASKAWSQLQHLKETLDELKQDGVITQTAHVLKYGNVGWDVGRLVFLARLCYDAGYISEGEAWSFIETANTLAQKTFRSWGDYAKSYVIGRAMWGGKQFDNSGIAMIADYLQKQPNSPWQQLSW
ncbi:MAG: DUF1266 domain-containing protein [Trueperaceae bacterium]